MKLRNKKTGEIIDVDFIYPETAEFFYPNFKLVDFNELFEDYEEPKECYYIDPSVMQGYCRAMTEQFPRLTKLAKELGIGFETKEEAEKTVEKLKAWKRLKDKGFRFCGGDDACISYETDIENWSMQDLQDFKVLFGGEE